jgi:hypothetical protein
MRAILLDSLQARTTAKKYIDQAADGQEVRIVSPDKSRDQEEKYHAMLADIARQCQHLNANLDLDTWKRLCIDQFKRDTLKDPECCARYWARHQLTVMPSLDGSAVIMLGEQSRRFPKGVATVFIEWLMAFAAERNVVLSDPTEVPLSAYSES